MAVSARRGIWVYLGDLRVFLFGVLGVERLFHAESAEFFAEIANAASKNGLTIYPSPSNFARSCLRIKASVSVSPITV